MSDPNRDAQRARQGRVVALVIIASGLGAMLAPWLVATLGLAFRFEMLIYFAALGGFVWAGVVAYQIWQTRDD